MLLAWTFIWLAIFGCVQSLPATSFESLKDTVPSDNLVPRNASIPEAPKLPLTGHLPTPFLFNYHNTEYFLNFTRFARAVNQGEGRKVLSEANEYIFERIHDTSDPRKSKLCPGSFRWAQWPLGYTMLMKSQTLCVSMGFFTDAMLQFEEQFGYFEAEVTFLVYVVAYKSYLALGAGQFALERLQAD